MAQLYSHDAALHLQAAMNHTVDEIGRVLIFSFIYEGVPNWAATDGVVLIEVPSQPPVEVKRCGPSSRSFSNSRSLSFNVSCNTPIGPT